MNSCGQNIKTRALALDALRGYAILTMVLSATVVYGILPGWMYHMQEPPPSHSYDSSLSGLTWVDLVFPFFLFAMGAAFPFSMRKRYEKGDTYLRLTFEALKRGIKLAFFAIFIQHFYPYMLSNPQDERAWLLAIACFLVLFPMFMRIPVQLPSWGRLLIQLSAYGIAICMMAFTHFAGEESFSLHTSNIIILLLANMAFFGFGIYLLTMYKSKLRIVVLLMLAGLLLSAQEQGSWVQELSAYSPFPWLYRFNYLQYLFIVLSGSMAGDLLMQYGVDAVTCSSSQNPSKKMACGVLFLSVLVVIVNLVGLYNRWSFLTFLLTVFLLLLALRLLHNQRGVGVLWQQLLVLGSFLLIIGLCFEPFQGGIKKDGPTFSYLLVTSGLACMALIFFHVICDFFKCHRSTSFLVMSGQNPMIAYVACDLLIYPVLHLLGIAKWLQIFTISPWMGFLQGVILTSLALLITMFFTRIKCFWRT